MYVRFWDVDGNQKLYSLHVFSLLTCSRKPPHLHCKISFYPLKIIVKSGRQYSPSTQNVFFLFCSFFFFFFGCCSCLKYAHV